MPITFNEIEAFENGAQFLNADLHVHSFGASHDVKDSTMTVEAIVDAAATLGIRILAITDHNTAANTEKSIEYAVKYTGQVLVLPGVEVTTANGHLLVYFAPVHMANVRNLLAKIDLVGKPGEQDSHTAMSMAQVIREAELLGGVCVAAHMDRPKNGFEMLATGYPNWKKDILLSPGLYALECDNPANLIWYSDSDEPTSNGTERKQLARTRGNVPAIVGRPLLAHVQGSDAHSLKDFTSGRSNKILTRFKLNELSYEAFRTALTDPEARVRAVATIPRALPRILGMQVTGGFLDTETYHFSDNLNCFIGGRGTGKSTALQTLAHGLGINDELESHNNCPGTVIIYCEDANGIRYRYERVQGAKPIVKAKEEGDIADVPADAFRVEYYRQGELAEVAKDPLKNPSLLQQFLDRHLLLSDLLSREAQLITALEQNSAQLIPLEGSVAQLTAKNQTLAETNKKLAIAEAGKLKDIAAEQSRLANEKSLATSLGQIRDEYASGLTLSNFVRDYATYETAVAPLTNVPACNAALLKIKNSVASVNTFLNDTEKAIKAKLGATAKEITGALTELKQAQSQLETQLNIKITELQKKGLSGSIAELQTLLKQKGALTQEINRINGQVPQLGQLRKDRQQYLSDLANVRVEITERRKGQLHSINQNLAATIQDYTVFVRYEPSGIIDEFKKYFLEKMHGTYFQEDVAEQFCSRLTPADLGRLVLNKDVDGIIKAGGVDKAWAEKICGSLRYFTILHALEVMWKSPCPIISVKTRGAKPKDIPVNQLSDGQKHTIMLTIAMLAESNIPLVIDQPEDDLDNAFIFSAVVKALRSIKERRQVILVTHNANIAVLGDAELLLPMRRNGDGGNTFDRGSIDKTETKKAALNILEGGDVAFRRRREIYGH
jgi:ABC-type phosphate transport system ATPase subunit